MKKIGEIKKIEHVTLDKPEEDLKFILWKAELNKELAAFWKAIFD